MGIEKTKPDPPLGTYKKLHGEYSKTLKCPCSNMIIPYERFITLSPILHQVCSSDLVTDRWISILKHIKPVYILPDWRDKAFSQFHLLSNLCKLANATINDAVHRFLLQSLIASNVLPQDDFDTQLNEAVDQFFQSTIAYFGLLVETTRILIQIDQPYFGMINKRLAEENPIVKPPTNGMNVERTPQVFLPRDLETVVFLSNGCAIKNDGLCIS
jgi:hypothetical protein